MNEMKREILPNGNIRLSSDKGIADSRSGRVYSVVVCKAEDERFFTEVEA